MARHRNPALVLLTRSLAVSTLALSLSACNMINRLADVGSEPSLSTIENPAKIISGGQQVSLPMPAPVEVERSPSSLWRPGSRAFLKDQRAAEVGDILTVIIEINDSAAISNQTNRSRTNAEDASATSFLDTKPASRASCPRQWMRPTWSIWTAPAVPKAPAPWPVTNLSTCAWPLW